MASRIQASPALSYCALLPFLAHRTSHPAAAKSPIWRPFSAGTLARRPRPMEVSAQARRGLSNQVVDFASPADMCFETPLKIVEYPDPVLRARNKRINTFDENLKRLVEEMFDVMYKTDGIGLSAPQVGVNVQLMVFNPAGERGEGEEIVLVNPIVYKVSKKILLYNEGCLSFPGIYADVERPSSVKVDARDISGGKFRLNLSGLPARIFQHEYDHLEGTLFFDRMTEDVLESISSDLKALEEKYEKRTGLPSPERIDNYKRRKEVAGFARTSSACRISNMIQWKWCQRLRAYRCAPPCYTDDYVSSHRPPINKVAAWSSRLSLL